VSADGAPDPALLKRGRGDGYIEVREERFDEAMEEDGFDSIIVGDECVWFHWRVVGCSLLVVCNDRLAQNAVQVK
jgi:hypothetical protein